MLKYFLLFLIIISICFSSCKKKSARYYISDELKKYFVFQKGSYWVYQNDITNEMDSSYVEKTISSVASVSNGDESYTYDVIDTYLNSHWIHTFVLNNACEPSSTKLYLELGEESSYSSYEPLAFDAGVPMNNHSFSTCGWPGGELFVEDISSIIINNVTYSNVIHSSLSSLKSTLSNSNELFDFYFSNNIGLIKCIITKNDSIQLSWSLIRFHINQ